ncbi:alpha mannosidase, middle domain [Caproiciproducens galactitolivorans]|uniref:Alpha mannosidase, middle domain n=1 Tax=Caproiciproducens galactitolivorans TaxID=642589 RepID=A0A4Z0YKT9_9FIRM|nr:alpha mannosidase, middle domain [Caproiciproducens galactitolivorans]
MARNKRGNRKSKFALMNLELISVWAEEYGVAYPEEEISTMWRTVLLNQFHDILPGSAIKDVYDVTRTEYAEIQKKSEALTKERLDVIASAQGTGRDSVVGQAWKRCGNHRRRGFKINEPFYTFVLMIFKNYLVELLTGRIS